MSENTDMVYMEKGEDGVAVVYLNQPKKKNAINATMMDLLTDCFHAADEDPEVRAIVLRGSGNCFTSGGDLSQSSPEENTPEHAPSRLWPWSTAMPWAAVSRSCSRAIWYA